MDQRFFRLHPPPSGQECWGAPVIGSIRMSHRAGGRAY